jgi:hypothetical protein
MFNAIVPFLKLTRHAFVQKLKNIEGVIIIWLRKFFRQVRSNINKVTDGPSIASWLML